MRSPLAAAAAGAAAGDMAFALCFAAWAVAQGVPFKAVMDVAPKLLWVASAVSLPGSLLLGWGIASRLGRSRRSRGTLLAHGSLWGWGLGTIHLVLLLQGLSPGYLERAFRDPSSEGFSLVCSGMVGAAAHGFACAWWASRP